MLSIAAPSFAFELTLTSVYLRLPTGHCAWIKRGGAADHTRPFFETWNDGMSRQVRLGRWEGVFDRERAVGGG